MWDKNTLKRKGSLILGMNQLLGNEKQKQTEEQKKQAEKLYSVTSWKEANMQQTVSLGKNDKMQNIILNLEKNKNKSCKC